MPGVLIVEAMAQTGAIAVLVEEENRGKIAFFAGIDDCRFKRVVEPGDVLTLACEIDTIRGPIGRGKATAHVGDALAARGTLTFAVERCDAGTAQGVRIGITGLGVHVPAKVMTNDELAGIVDTSDEWIRERTGIRERRIASEDEALTDIALPAAAPRSTTPASTAADDRPPHLRDGDAGHDVPDLVGAPRGRARHAARGGVRPPRRLHGLRLRDRAGLRDARVGALAARARRRWRRALEDPRLGGPLDARPLRRRRRAPSSWSRSSAAGFIGFELGADGGGGEYLWYPGSGSRHFDDPDSFVKMNGREVFKFATRVMVLVGERDPRRVRQDRRRHRRLRPAPGEQADHRLRGG